MFALISRQSIFSMNQNERNGNTCAFPYKQSSGFIDDSVLIKMLSLILSSMMLANLAIDPTFGCFGRPNCTGRIDEEVTFEDSYEFTMEAFDFCDADEDGCLTWNEIEPCEVSVKNC